MARHRHIIAALFLTTCVFSSPLHAASVGTSYAFAANNVGLDGGTTPTFDSSTTADLGIATLRFGAEASGGDVDANANLDLMTTFSNAVSLGEAANFDVGLRVNAMSFEYDTLTGAEAGAFVNFKSFAGIDLNEFRVIGEDYTVVTAESGTRFGVNETDSGSARIVGVGPSVSLGLGVRAEVTLNAAQSSSMRVNSVDALVLATHESGQTRSGLVSFTDTASSMLDLGLVGTWDLSLQNVQLRNSFDSASGLAAGYELGLAFGETFGGCGNYATDSDNVNSLTTLTFCGGDIGVSGQTSQLSLINPSPFELAWGSFSRDLGQVVVAAPLASVPVPASLPLLLAALGLGYGLRRRAGHPNAPIPPVLSRHPV